MIRVYTASKMSHARLWIDLWEEVKDIHWTASWPFMSVAGLLDSPENAQRFWYKDLKEVAGSDAVLCYADNEKETLRGALVEAGAALGMKRHVVCVGNNPGFGTWQYHPLVHRYETLDEAIEILRRMPRYGS